MRLITLLIIITYCSVSNAQTILSATPDTGYQGTTLTITIATSAPVDPDNVALVNGTNTIYPWDTYDLGGNKYRLPYILRDYEQTGAYTLKTGSYSFPTPIVVASPDYKEIFNYNSVTSINIITTDRFTDGIQKIAVDNFGNKYCVGTFYNYATLGNKRYYPKGKKDGFVMKMDPAGTVVWVRIIGSSKDDNLNWFEGMTSVKVFNDSAIYITGFFRCDSTLTLDTTQLNFPVNSNGSQNGLLMKLDTSGKALWYAFQGSSQYGETNDLDIDNNGNVYATGYLQSNPTFVYSADLNDSLTLNTVSSSAIYIAKYSPGGNAIWAKKQDEGIAQGLSIKLASDRSIVLLAYTELDVTYDGSYCDNTSCCNPHYCILKTDSAGNRLWCLEGGNYNELLTIGMDQWDNIYFPFNGTLIKYDKYGNQLWGKSISQNWGNEGIYPAVTDKNGNTYVAYECEDQMIRTQYTVIARKIDSSGTVIACTYPLPYTANDYNTPTTITLNPSEDKVYLAGNYTYPQTFGTTTIDGFQNVFFNEMNTSINTVTGVNTLAEDFNTIIYPNPSHGSFRILTSHKIKELNIYDLPGKNIYSQTCPLPEGSIDLSALPKGLYFIKLVDDNNVSITRKLIID